MVSPLVTSLGIGKFGLEYSIGFPITVALAHLAYGAALGILIGRFAGPEPSPLWQSFRALFTAHGPAQRSTGNSPSGSSVGVS
jgi:hypothetical protein